MNIHPAFFTFYKAVHPANQNVRFKIVRHNTANLLAPEISLSPKLRVTALSVTLAILQFQHAE